MKRVIFLIDFDRTITMNDSTDELMKIHNPELLNEYQEKFRNGLLTVKEYISGLVKSLKLTKEAYENDVCKNVVVDDYFIEFLKLGLETRVVSAGTYQNIIPVLKKKKIDYPAKHIYSNNLKFTKDRIEIEFPHGTSDSTEGICKASIVQKYKQQYDFVVFIGDGYSDIEASKWADIVFAKEGKSLERYLKQQGKSYYPYKNFKNIINTLDEIKFLR